uniref:Transcription initiation factor IIF subunit alpha n=1 Tax=Hirondellea gigas TaxID=1518452 RepID=A0A2P2HW54_9CRUS
MSQPTQPNGKEYIVRVPKNSRKRYSTMRFHTANCVDFKNWNSAKMERENNYKEFKSAQDDQPKFGAGSEFGREQRDEARRKRYGINIKKYKPDNQPWLLSVKDKINSNGVGAGPTTSHVKKFKGIREGGVSDNVAWYVFLQAKDGAFEAYPIEEWYNFQPINRYKSLNAEEAEKEFERRDKIVNYFSVMYQKKLRNEEEDADGEDGGKKKAASKILQLSEMDDWMSDKDSDDDDSDEDGAESRKRRKKPTKSKKKARQGGKRTRTEDGDSGTDCEEESDDFNEGAEHEYVDEDSSDPDQDEDEKATKDLAGVEENKALKKLLNSDDEDDDEELDRDDIKHDKPDSDDEKKKKKKTDSSPDLSESSDDEKTKPKDTKKSGSNASSSNADILKRKLADNPDGLMAASKRPRSDTPTQPVSVLPGESGMFEDQIRRYLVRKPMTTTEILQKLKSKKTGHNSEQLVEIIAIMLKKVNPQKQRVKGKMYLSLKTLNG